MPKPDHTKNWERHQQQHCRCGRVRSCKQPQASVTTKLHFDLSKERSINHFFVLHDANLLHCSIRRSSHHNFHLHRDDKNNRSSFLTLWPSDTATFVTIPGKELAR